MDERAESLRHCPVLAGFTDVGLSILAAVAQERVFLNAQALATQGEPPREPGAVLFLTKGRVRCEVRDSEGKMLGLGTLGAGDHLGGLRLFAQGPAALSAIAEGEVRALAVDRAAFARLQKDKPRTAMKLLYLLASDFGKHLAESATTFADFARYAATRVNILERGQYASYADLGLDNTPTLSPVGLMKASDSAAARARTGRPPSGS